MTQQLFIDKSRMSSRGKGDQDMTVTVYTKPACVQCNATYRALDKKGIAYQSVDISQDPAALEPAAAAR